MALSLISIKQRYVLAGEKDNAAAIPSLRCIITEGEVILHFKQEGVRQMLWVVILMAVLVEISHFWLSPLSGCVLGWS